MEKRPLRYSDEYRPAAYQLFELDEHLLAQLGLDAQGRATATGGGSHHQLTIRGDADDAAVVCSDERTYLARQAEVSNTFLVVRDGVAPPAATDDARPAATWEILAALGTYVELLRGPARVEKLRALLGQWPYGGADAEDDTAMAIDASQRAVAGRPGSGSEPPARRRYTLSELQDVIAASDTELRDALNAIEAFELDGYWRLLDRAYLNEVLELILTNAKANGWPLSAVPEAACETELGDYPPTVVRHSLRLFSDAPAPVDGCWALSNKRVCRVLARQLFETNARWHLHEFLVAWNALVPDEFQPEFEWLRGLAVVDTDAAGNEVASYFPLDALPKDPARRFEQLFAKRVKWTLDDLRPYLQDLAADSKAMDALLLKHTRMSSHPTQKDLKLYSSR